MTRQEANRIIAKQIMHQVEEHPDIRFTQLLVALELNGDFYEESEDTLEKMLERSAIYEVPYKGN